MADPIMRRVSIPSMNFRGNKFVNEDGTLTDVAQGFFDTLQKTLISNIGEEGLVAPSQSTTDKLTIQNNIVTSVTNNQTYTCQFGTFLYDYNAKQVFVALDSGIGPVMGAPIFKQVVTM